MRRSTRKGYIQVKGGKVWYSISGRNKSLPPIIVLHGGPGASHYYMKPLRGLASERPVILYDQLGCGKSDKLKDKSLWTIEHYTEELDDIRNALGLERLHILGQSWGAMVAVEYMLTRAPKGVISLVLSAPSLSAPRWHEDCRSLILEMSEKDCRIIMDSEASGNFNSSAYRRATFAFYRKHLCRLKPWPVCVMRTLMSLRKDIYNYMWGPSEFTITGTLKDYDRSDELENIDKPALFTCGRYDEATPESTEYFHMMTPRSEFVVFEDASHMHHVEKTRLYLNTVRSFLARAEEFEVVS